VEKHLFSLYYVAIVGGFIWVSISRLVQFNGFLAVPLKIDVVPCVKVPS